MKHAYAMAVSVFTYGVASFAALALADDAPAGAKDVGLRYGQALGVMEVCYGSKLTDKAKALETAYTGADLEAFKLAAATTYDAWVKVRGCTNQKDPNTCKIIMDRSCQAAEAEIGPEGKAIPGLVEFAKR